MGNGFVIVIQTSTRGTYSRAFLRRADLLRLHRPLDAPLSVGGEEVARHHSQSRHFVRVHKREPSLRLLRAVWTAGNSDRSLGHRSWRRTTTRSSRTTTSASSVRSTTRKRRRTSAFPVHCVARVEADPNGVQVCVLHLLHVQRLETAPPGRRPSSSDQCHVGLVPLPSPRGSRLTAETTARCTRSVSRKAGPRTSLPTLAARSLKPASSSRCCLRS